MLFEQFSPVEVATAQLPCASDTNIYYCRSTIKSLLITYTFHIFMCKISLIQLQKLNIIIDANNI